MSDYMLNYAIHSVEVIDEAITVIGARYSANEDGFFNEVFYGKYDFGLTGNHRVWHDQRHNRQSKLL